MKAEASHILVDSEEKAQKLKAEIDSGSVDFATAARTRSSCPSSNAGGALGSFQPGAMVKEFNDIIFTESNELHVVHGPVKTSFGWHLIVITNRG